ncbi:DUF4255 domain-containing protein [Erythrobacter oryzae]|uniref:DUF4255 domain-containing protein n=1 Tax=Erythrobacter oryzae TaxID=3019556 RepID=UPI002555A58B|nr:DUF4255 domain-containing protein [Erythrobacter sp. COR-2]
MARHMAIAAVCAAIKGVLSETYPRSQFGTKLKIDTIQPKDVATLSDEGIAILLWRVTVNTQRRGLPPRVDADGRTFRPSLPLDLHIMMLPYATNAERQHRILGWMMRAMADAGAINAGQLNHYLSETDVFPAIESVEPVCDPLATADYITMWSRIEKAPLGINYLVRMVLIDSEMSLDTGAPVVERVIKAGVPAE